MPSLVFEDVNHVIREQDDLVHPPTNRPRPAVLELASNSIDVIDSGVRSNEWSANESLVVDPRGGLNKMRENVVQREYFGGKTKESGALWSPWCERFLFRRSQNPMHSYKKVTKPNIQQLMKQLRWSENFEIGLF